MHAEAREELRVRFKVYCIGICEAHRREQKTCCEFDVARSTFYEWKKTL